MDSILLRSLKPRRASWDTASPKLFPVRAARAISFHKLDGGQEQVKRMIEAAETGADGQEVFHNTFKFQ